MSDIHGNYEKYIKAIKAIELKDDDTLFVLGDVVDRGENPIKILQDMMCRTNVIPLLGNHEFMAISFLKVFIKEITDKDIASLDRDFLISMQHWLDDGGKTTLDEFNKLSKEDRGDILEYLVGFQLYKEISCSGKDYILVHAGLDNFKRKKKLSDYKLTELIYCETDYNKVYFKDKILVTGHTPVSFITNGKSETIYKENNHIAIDCGCGFGRKLGVMCLDNEQEYYF